jgi:hypothetical protein
MERWAEEAAKHRMKAIPQRLKPCFSQNEFSLQSQPVICHGAKRRFMWIAFVFAGIQGEGPGLKLF